MIHKDIGITIISNFVTVQFWSLAIFTYIFILYL